MAMDQNQRNEKLAAKRAKFAEKELRHRVRPGIEEALKRLRARADDIETSELLQVAILKMDLMGDEDLSQFLKYPRHEIIVSESVAREIYDHGVRCISNNPDQDEDDEIERPA
ncbi:hypothetical protein K3169_13825 [Pseudomonas phytophila]|uniref:Uncharacterized protein n=1 Tax=Pseudomonas phytophila TaxID=2867264 RepID=A0ABY6FLN7_9PSED|nr:hypothetical protein [Pseudomonas phytophila]UXZ98862.1 hypothetical protein K3169_13825 [Pseudomonas phytophila]